MKKYYKDIRAGKPITYWKIRIENEAILIPDELLKRFARLLKVNNK